MKRLTNTDFFLMFFAALREIGTQAIRIRDDEHQRRFQELRELLRRNTKFPLLMPNPYTGRYQEFDDALLDLQTGVIGAKNPYYQEIFIDLPKSTAKELLATCTPEERDEFRNLASKFNSAQVSVTTT